MSLGRCHNRSSEDEAVELNAVEVGFLGLAPHFRIDFTSKVQFIVYLETILVNSFTLCRLCHSKGLI